MPKPNWKTKSKWLAVALALLVVANPEVRALLLLVDAIGIEVVALLLITQARIWLPMLSYGVAGAWQFARPLIWRFAALIVTVLSGALPREGLRLIVAHSALLGWTKAKAISSRHV